MRTFFLIATLAVALGHAPAPRAGGLDAHLDAFPGEPARAPGTPQTYSLDYGLHVRDVSGVVQSRTQVRGEYTRKLEGDRFRWNAVTIAGGGEGVLSDPAPLAIMEGFEYGLSEEIVDESLYECFPGNDLRDLAKTMVWDGMMLELVDMTLDAVGPMPLNEFVPVETFEGFEVAMCDWGKLEMRDLRLKWSGVSMMHGEPCGVALYQSFANPVDAEPTRGRSCYWGQFWVSLEDREIECLTLNEDVVLETPVVGGPASLLNIQREVRFEKIR
ncbi:MAG: hypothetical protein GF400_09015 [Candidatus Eisenbacteria bacterium]|nr:hypothetical protein [Candidatus Eisenbacteria bacterium]